MKLTIVITNYNSIDYYKALYTSLVLQSCREFNVIVIDDCSTDGSYEAWKEIEKKLGFVKVYKTEKNSGGPSIPRNLGLTYVTTPYVTFVDGDDYIHENFVKNFYNTIAEDDYDYICDGTSENRITWCHSGFYKMSLIDTYNIKFPTLDDYKIGEDYDLKFPVNEDAIFSVLLYSVASKRKPIKTYYYYSRKENSLLGKAGLVYNVYKYAKYSYAYYMSEFERLKSIVPNIEIPIVWKNRLIKDGFLPN